MMEHMTNPHEPTLKVRDATCTVTRASVPAELFTNLSLDLNAGEILDLTGASGEGKSSLLTLIAQLNPRGSATLSLNGTDSKEFTFQQWRRHVAYLPQKPTLLGEDVAAAIRLPWTLKVNQSQGAPVKAPDDEHLRKALDDLGCEDIELDRAPRNLSGGQAARVALLRSILTAPDVLLADEVDAGLDDENAAKVAAMMAKAASDGMAICRIRHRAADGYASRSLTLVSGVLKEATL